MDRRVAALALAVGWLAAAPPAPAQPVAPTEPIAPVRPEPAATFLLPPIAPGSRPADPPTARGADPADRPAPRPRADLPEGAPPAARLSAPRDVTPVSAQAVEEVRKSDRPADPPLRGDGLLDYLTDGRRSRRTDEADERSSGFGKKLGDKMQDALDPDTRRGWFRSDHAFDCFVSPVTNPFLFEDPRALTEVRPIFIYQKIPGPQPNFNGGNIYFIGTQARVAIADRFSLVINKIGGIAVDAGSDSPYGNHFGLSELWLGPKVTIIRDSEYGTLLAAGATFQIPLGSANVYQDTGSLSIVPYVSFGQNFLRTRLGSFNLLASTGYSFATDHQRSDYYYASAHLDYDVANAHKFYPLVELNWFQYTTDGQARFIAGEGRDLVNFGSLAKGSSLLTGAIGGRAKLFRNTELGAAFEVPLAGNRDFFRYRFTVDFIWRY